MNERAPTFPGTHAPLPTPGSYVRPHASFTPAALVVDFHGDDGRRASFDVGALPLPGWHQAMAEALNLRVGPSGDRRTHSSAKGVFGFISRLLRFLNGLDDPPDTPAALTIAHVDQYLNRSATPRAAATRTADLNELRPILRLAPLNADITPQVLDHVSTPSGKGEFVSLTGYSDGEFARIVDAARADVAAIRARITAGEDHLAALTASGVEPTSEIEQSLSDMALSGVVPLPGGQIVSHRHQRTAWAGQLFVTRADLPPLLTLLVAMTGRNIETLKELSAEHRLIGTRAVEVQLVKRRKGPNRWHDTVTWEIGPPHRQLHTPGGLYLLLHRLTARGRAFSGSHTIWSSWRNTNTYRGSVAEHHDPFADNLAGRAALATWSTRRALLTDPDASGHTAPLSLDLRRVRTSVEVRRTRQMGGHLPSAARSNSVAVLFAHYLRGDPSTTEWAQHTIAEALQDAESAALAAHRHALTDHGSTALDVRTSSDDEPTTGREEGAWTACTDSAAHPATGRACARVSFLDCFHCGNCVVTAAHLPAITALAATMATRRTQVDEPTWWLRYGPAWTAIHHDIYPKFTAAQLETATANAPECLLELAEDPWEHP